MAENTFAMWHCSFASLQYGGVYSVNSISRRALELEIAMMLHDKHGNEGSDKVIVKKVNPI